MTFSVAIFPKQKDLEKKQQEINEETVEKLLNIGIVYQQRRHNSNYKTQWGSPKWDEEINEAKDKIRKLLKGEK